MAFFLGMVLTPPDPMSQMLMAVPLCVLYELSIWGVRFKEICSGEASGDGKRSDGKKTSSGTAKDGGDGK
jgi:sec-independent protein translocase protein TatC